MERSSVDTVYVALHLSLRMSRQMLPLMSMLGWKIGVSNLTVGADIG